MGAILRALESEAAEKGIPAEIIEYAARATAAAMDYGLPEALDRRSRAYFGAVVRRRLARSRVRTSASARLIADSVVEDLLSEGRVPAEVIEELERGWSGTIPDAVIDEYRMRLCA